MKNFLLIIFFLPMAVLAQRSKEIQLRFNGGIGGYAAFADYRVQFGNDTYLFTDTSGAATRQVELGARYELTHRFNVGLDLRLGSYIYDPEENNTNKSNTFRMLGIAAEFNAVSKPNFRWFFGGGLRVARLTITEPLFQGIEEQRGTTRWGGSGLLLQTGILAFFGEGPVGASFNFGFDSNAFKLNEYSIDGDKQDLTGWKANLNTAGVLINAGLLWRFQ